MENSIRVAPHEEVASASGHVEAGERAVLAWVWSILWVPTQLWMNIAMKIVRLLSLGWSSLLEGFQAGWAGAARTTRQVSPPTRAAQPLPDTKPLGRVGTAGEAEVELTEPKPTAKGCNNELPTVVVSDSEAENDGPRVMTNLETSRTLNLCIQVPSSISSSKVPVVEWNPSFELARSDDGDVAQPTAGLSPPSTPTSPYLDIPSSPDRPSFSRSSSVSSSSSWASEHSGTAVESGVGMVRIGTSIAEEEEEDEEGHKTMTSDLHESTTTTLTSLAASSSSSSEAAEEACWDTAMAWVNSARLLPAASPSAPPSPSFDTPTFTINAPSPSPVAVIISAPEDACGTGVSKASYAWLVDGEVEFDESRLGPFSVFGNDQPSDVLEDYYSEEDEEEAAVAAAQATWSGTSSGSWALTEDEEGYDEFGAMPDWCEGGGDPFAV